MAKKVFISAGHGGSDPGAVANGLKEKDLNLAISLACRDELTRHGVTVKMSRTKDENDPVTDEVKECNAFDPDYAVSIHINAGGGNGFEIYHTVTNDGGKGKALATNINAEVLKIGQNSRGVKTRANGQGKDYYGFIRQTKAPAVIAECAFIDSKTDIAIIDTAAEQKTFGIAIAKGILKTLGIACKAPSNSTVNNQPETSFPTEWAWAVKKGITDGSNPKGTITREQVVAMLYRLCKANGTL